MKTIQSLSESSNGKLTESDMELVNKTVKYINQTVYKALLDGRESAFFLLTNEDKGYSKRVQKAIETRVTSMTFPIKVRIHLKDKE